MSSANAPALPPLLSCTPPPIDFGEEDDDDSNLPLELSLDDDEDMFGDFANASTNDDGDNAGANANGPSLPQTPVHADLPPLPDLCFDDQGCSLNSSNSPPPLLEAQASPGRTDEQTNKASTRMNGKPIEAFNLNVSLAVAATETNLSDSDVILADERKPIDDDLAKSQTEVEPNPSLTLLKCDSLSTHESESLPPCSPSPTDQHVNFSEMSDGAWPQNSTTDSDSENVNQTDEIREQIVNEDEEKITKEATSTTAAGVGVTSEMVSCSISGATDSVVLEDIADDSSDDEHYSPKKLKSLIVVADENSAEFFAIHPLSVGASNGDGDCGRTSATNAAAARPTTSTLENDNEEAKDDENEDDFDDFACFDTAAAPIFVPKLDTVQSSFSSEENSNAFDANFNQFSDFTSAPPPPLLSSDAENQNTEWLQAVAHAPSDIAASANLYAEDDNFDDCDDDFQEFCAASPEISQLQEDSATKSCANSPSDSGDDFGDFTEATIGTTSGPLTPSTPTTASLQYGTATSHNNYDNSAGKQELATASIANQGDINLRLKPVLEMMFPIATANGYDKDAKIPLATQLQPSFIQKMTTSNSIHSFQLESIDSARALDYHWTKSEMRHALIKSLGIDSRNILFGEKWNSSMPRFAANLSFNPLLPIKSTSSSSSSQPPIYAEAFTTTTATHATQMHQQFKDANSTARGVDVPAVEFDWTSSGLVNPLDGPKEDVRTRETEALHASKSGRFIADASSSSPAADGRQESHSTNADYIGGSSSSRDVDANCASVDRATAATATTGAAAATTLPPIVPADSVGNGIHNNGVHTNLGYHTSTADGVMIDAANDKKASLSGATLMSTKVGLAKHAEEKSVDNSDDDDDDEEDEVVATSTFSGPLKETHIYTPSKGEGGNGCAVAKTMPRPGGGNPNPSTKVSPIDFDYEIAAAGIIIDETVVKKEYRDVEYNPGFDLQFSRTSPPAQLAPSAEVAAASSSSLSTPLAEIGVAFVGIAIGESSSTANPSTEIDDEFSDFQSVEATVSASAVSTFSMLNMSAGNLQSAPTMAVNRMRENSTFSRTGTPTFGDQMILSPAILLPQAIAIDSSKPKIEWGGDSMNSINPEELARIEELFPQPLAKHVGAAVAKTKDAMANSSQRSTPTHDGHKQQKPHTPSISATIAHKEQQQSGVNDDDDWSEFVSVPATANTNVLPQSHAKNNNHLTVHQRHCSPPAMHPHHQHHRQQHATYSPQKSSVKTTASSTLTNSFNNDDEWSDFVSSTPPATTTPQFGTNAPQFNSAAWQNANFYNNPLSFYHQSHTSVMPTNANSNAFAQIKLQNNNNNINPYLPNYQQQQQPKQQQHAPPLSAQQFQPQKIHIMKDFSTAAPSTQNSRSKTSISKHVTSASAYSSGGSSQYQVGSAKVAPSISLIPDLGFVAPAIPAHTAFIHNLPKPSFQTKK